MEGKSPAEVRLLSKKALRFDHVMAERLFLVNKPRKQYHKTARVFAIQIEDDFEIETREGWLKAKGGDYLVVNVSPGISYPWPVKKEIFESTYTESV